MQGNALVRHHLLRVADGKEAAWECITACRAAAADGPVTVDTARVAALASHPQNALRDLLRMYDSLSGLHLEPYEVKLPMRASRAADSAVHEVRRPICLTA